LISRFSRGIAEEHSSAFFIHEARMVMGMRNLLVVATLSVAVSSESRAFQEAAAADLGAALDRVFTMQEKIRDLHPAFGRLYPIAIVREGAFYVYEPDPAGRHYRPVLTAPDKFHVPAGVRAAMPLDFWGNRIACVITPEALDDTSGLIVVFHEFVHCYQWETCEMRLKEKMPIYQAAIQRNDYMWELQYAFPYERNEFRQNYSAMIAALEKGDMAGVAAIRSKLKEGLSSDDWDYMTWQEWKEGLARYLENAIQARLGQAENRGGLIPPYTRVTFYAGGAALIRALSIRQPGILNDIADLYHRIAER
jgi:hypothetical protein